MAWRLDLIHHLAAINGTKRFHEQADLVIRTNVTAPMLHFHWLKNKMLELLFTPLQKLMVKPTKCRNLTHGLPFHQHPSTKDTLTEHQNILMKLRLIMLSCAWIRCENRSAFQCLWSTSSGRSRRTGHCDDVARAMQGSKSLCMEMVLRHDHFMDR